MNEWAPMTAHTSAEASLVEKLADLLAAASDTVAAARQLRGRSPDRAARIEGAVKAIYDQVESLLQELAD